MRKLIIIFLFGISFNSCTPETDYYAQVAAVDAAASHEWIMSHGGYAFVISDFYLGGLGGFTTAASMIGGIASGNYASAERLSSERLQIKTDYILPNQYIVTQNPFECVGFSHNRILQLIRTKDIGLNDLISMDTGIIKPMIRLVELCNPEMNVDSTYDRLMKAKFDSTLRNVNQEYYSGGDLINILRDKVTTDTTGMANYMLQYVNRLRANFPNEDYIEIIEDINYFIESELANPSSFHELKLIFLTVLKHSTYYWR